MQPQPASTILQDNNADASMKMASFFKLMSLPPELHIQLTTQLEFPDSISLKTTCAYFYHLIPALNHTELLNAETTEFAVSKDLYACRYCRRLRPGRYFADRMLCRGRGRRGRDARKRFCVECGLAPRGESGEARYGRGAQLFMQGVYHVICCDCGNFELGIPGWKRVRCARCLGAAMYKGSPPGC
ncbi:hypothetical protein BJX76DRAFT_321545 [Aspergillus varians]